MGLPNIFNTGRSGMMASKAAISTTGHNISNANTEGYSRQRVQTTSDAARPYGKGMIGTGTLVDRVERVNDEYIEKQIRNSSRDMAHLDEKDVVLRQTEDIFNEMSGDGLNRLVSNFFNEFRKLANEPDNEAVRQSVRESSQAMVNDFKRLRNEVDQVRRHIDSRMDHYVSEVNAKAEEVRDLNTRILQFTFAGTPANDLLDKRDKALKDLSTYMDLQTHTDKEGSFIVDIKGVGPLVCAGNAEKFFVERSPADADGKIDGALDLRTTASAQSNVTHTMKGGKFGALLEVRDQVLSTVTDRLDELAFNLSQSVNEIHAQGFNRNGVQGIDFFRQLDSKDRASEFIGLSAAIEDSVNNIATAGAPDSPGDNRVAIAISGVQGQKLMNEGRTTLDDFYNSIVADVGVATSKNRSGMNQQKDMITNLQKMRDQISGVSVDEETANLMQYQHAYEASAKVISVADEMLKTVLDLRR